MPRDNQTRPKGLQRVNLILNALKSWCPNKLIYLMTKSTGPKERWMHLVELDNKRNKCSQTGQISLLFKALPKKFLTLKVVASLASLPPTVYPHTHTDTDTNTHTSLEKFINFFFFTDEFKKRIINGRNKIKRNHFIITEKCNNGIGKNFSKRN